MKKKNNAIYIICHTVILTEENAVSFKNKENFVCNGHLTESENLNKKYKNNTEEIFTKYQITFDSKSDKKIVCEDNTYKINLKSKRSLVKNKLDLFNAYKFKNGEEIKFIHYVKFINEDKLINSFYLKIN